MLIWMFFDCVLFTVDVVGGDIVCWWLFGFDISLDYGA